MRMEKKRQLVKKNSMMLGGVKLQGKKKGVKQIQVANIKAWESRESRNRSGPEREH